MPTKTNERRVLYQQRKAKGYCPRCGAKVSKREKFIYCKDCREFHRNYHRENSEIINERQRTRYDDRKEGNKCPRCGKTLGKKYTKTLCSSCLSKQYKYNYGKDRRGK